MNREETEEFFRFLEDHDFKVNILPDITSHKELRLLKETARNEDILSDSED